MKINEIMIKCGMIDQVPQAQAETLIVFFMDYAASYEDFSKIVEANSMTTPNYTFWILYPTEPPLFSFVRFIS